MIFKVDTKLDHIEIVDQDVEITVVLNPLCLLFSKHKNALDSLEIQEVLNAVSVNRAQENLISNS